jgi:hypothetical protein
VPVHDEREGGETDRAGPWRREKKEARGATARRLTDRARETEREGESAWGRKTGADRLAPAGRERKRESARG